MINLKEQEQIARLAEENKVLREALENFKLGHEHAAGLSHIRVMGDTYGWCDYCQEKVSFGPGEAEAVLASLAAGKEELSGNPGTLERGCK